MGRARRTPGRAEVPAVQATRVAARVRRVPIVAVCVARQAILSRRAVVAAAKTVRAVRLAERPPRRWRGRAYRAGTSSRPCRSRRR